MKIYDYNGKANLIEKKIYDLRKKPDFRKKNLLQKCD